MAQHLNFNQGLGVLHQDVLNSSDLFYCSPSPQGLVSETIGEGRYRGGGQR